MRYFGFCFDLSFYTFLSWCHCNIPCSVPYYLSNSLCSYPFNGHRRSVKKVPSIIISRLYHFLRPRMDIPSNQVLEFQQSLNGLTIGVDGTRNVSEVRIQELKSALKLLESKVLSLRAKDCGRRADDDKEDDDGELNSLVSAVNELHTDFDKVRLCNKAFKMAVESTVASAVVNAETHHFTPDSFEKANTLLKEKHDIQVELLGVHEKHLEALEKLDSKKVELKQELHLFKSQLTEQEKQIDLKTSEHSAKLKENIDRKVKEINTMRNIILNIIGASGINLLKHPEVLKMLPDLRNPVTATKKFD